MFQKLTIVGNLGRDPELRYTPNGNAVTTLNVATNHKYTKGSGEQVDEVTWFRVQCWGKLAEACHQYLSKGRKVLVEGRLISTDAGNPRIWTQQSGEPAASFEVNAAMVLFLGGGNGESEEVAPPAPRHAEEIESFNYDIPF